MSNQSAFPLSQPAQSEDIEIFFTQMLQEKYHEFKKLVDILQRLSELELGHEQKLEITNRLAALMNPYNFDSGFNATIMKQYFEEKAFGEELPPESLMLANIFYQIISNGLSTLNSTQEEMLKNFLLQLGNLAFLDNPVPEVGTYAQNLVVDIRNGNAEIHIDPTNPRNAVKSALSLRDNVPLLRDHLKIENIKFLNALSNIGYRISKSLTIWNEIVKTNVLYFVLPIPLHTAEEKLFTEDMGVQRATRVDVVYGELIVNEQFSLGTAYPRIAKEVARTLFITATLDEALEILSGKLPPLRGALYFPKDDTEG